VTGLQTPLNTGKYPNDALIKLNERIEKNKIEKRCIVKHYGLTNLNLAFAFHFKDYAGNVYDYTHFECVLINNTHCIVIFVVLHYVRSNCNIKKMFNN
jgi:hypothetical protein